MNNRIDIPSSLFDTIVDLVHPPDPPGSEETIVDCGDYNVGIRRDRDVVYFTIPDSYEKAFKSKIDENPDVSSAKLGLNFDREIDHEQLGECAVYRIRRPLLLDRFIG